LEIFSITSKKINRLSKSLSFKMLVRKFRKTFVATSNLLFIANFVKLFTATYKYKFLTILLQQKLALIISVPS